MVDFRPEVIRRFFCAITLFGFVECQLSACAGGIRNLYYLHGDCNYLCSAQKVINGNLLCKSDHHTVVPCSEDRQMDNLREEDCTKLRCLVVFRTSQCHDLPDIIYLDARFIRSNVPRENVTHSPIYIYPANKPNLRPSHEDLPRITFEEPSSQMYMYGILSFFFGVIAFFIFALVFRFLYKRYQRHPVHVHTFSGHQLPLGSLQLRSFLSPSPYPPQLPFPHNEQVGIPGLDLPPSYVVASELLDPPPSYEDISKPKRHSAQMKVTSL